MGTLGVVVAPQGADAAVVPHMRPAMCPPDISWETIQVGSRYYLIDGPTVGKYNSSTNSANLTYALSTTSTHTSGWTASAQLSYNEMVVDIQATFGVSVTNSVATNLTFTNYMNVLGHHYGRTTLKVEYTNYEAEEWRLNGNCVSSTLIYTTPVFKAITAKYYFAECQDTTNTCTPKP